jgi:hypothetical protein
MRMDARARLTFGQVRCSFDERSRGTDDRDRRVGVLLSRRATIYGMLMVAGRGWSPIIWRFGLVPWTVTTIDFHHGP